MIQIPHSAAVHIPLALSVIFPVAHGVRLVLIRKKFLPEQTWLLHWALCALQVVTCALSYISGQRDQLLSSAATDLLTQHRDLAQWFSAAWLVIFLVYPTVLWAQGPKRLFFYHLVLVALLATQLYLALKLGHLGGQMVFG